MRIASLQPSITITLAGLDRLDLLCAHTRYCLEALPELAVRRLPVLHDSWTSNAAEIKATRPDLVIASVPYRMESLAEILKAGMPALTFAPHSLADVFADIRMLAALTDARAGGEALVAGFEAELDRVRKGAAGADPQTVYCEEWGKPLIHSQLWVAELVAAAGGTFVGSPGVHTTAESIAAADPDVLIFAWCGAGDRVPLRRVVEQRNWNELRAVREGRVFCIPDQWLNTPAITLLDGLRSLAATLHPKLFSLPKEVIALDGASQRRGAAGVSGGNA